MISPMNRILLAIVVVLLSIAATTQVAEAGVWQTIYSTDFSADPGWTTNSSGTMYWDATGERYHLQNSCSGPEYVFKNFSYSSSLSYRLAFDITVTRADWGAAVRFGFGDADMSFGQPVFWTVDYGNGYEGTVAIGSYNSGFSGWDYFATRPYFAYTLGATYHNIVIYDSTAQTLSWQATRVSDGALMADFTKTVGIFTGVDRLFSSQIDNNYVPGATAEAYIDNVVLSQTPEPATLALVALGFGAMVFRHKNKELGLCKNHAKCGMTILVFLVVAVTQMPHSAFAASITSLVGDKDNFGWGLGNTVPNIYFDNRSGALPSHDGTVFDALIYGNNVHDWNHQFSLPLGAVITSASLRVREVQSSFYNTSRIRFDGGAWRDFTTNGLSVVMPIIQTFTIAGSLLSDGILIVRFDENGDDIALDYSELIINYTPDTTAPVSAVAALPGLTTITTFDVLWAGNDGATGAGIAAFDIFLSENDGPFVVWLGNTTKTSSQFAGVAGSTYAFYSVARDWVGNIEAAPAMPDAVTTVVPEPATLSLLALGGLALLRRHRK